MRRVSYVLALLLCFGLKAFAQETFKSDIFVGYSYERIGFANAQCTHVRWLSRESQRLECSIRLEP